MPDAPVSLTEPPYTFAFGSIAWAAAVKYDESATHLAIMPIQSVQAVDFVALGNRSCKKLALIEIKDYTRGTRSPTIKELAIEVAQKVAGTLVGLASRPRHPTHDFRWKDAGKHLLSKDVPIVVYLHADYPGDDVDYVRGQLESLRAELAAKLSWLPNCEVIPCNRQRPKIPDCAIGLA